VLEALGLDTGEVRTNDRKLLFEDVGLITMRPSDVPTYVAAGAADEATAFVRVMILPREYLGRSSIRYMLPEDQDKPKRQSYQIYIDAPITLPGSSA